jgi:DNA mismatch repair ATPase MutS
MDELGRGTSTYDGYSLANSVLSHLHNINRGRLLFTTHYHWLVDDFKIKEGIKLYTMLIQ